MKQRPPPSSLHTHIQTHTYSKHTHICTHTHTHMHTHTHTRTRTHTLLLSSVELLKAVIKENKSFNCKIILQFFALILSHFRKAHIPLHSTYTHCFHLTCAYLFYSLLKALCIYYLLCKTVSGTTLQHNVITNVCIV